MNFNILGPLEITSEGSPVPLNARRPRALLAILLLHHCRIVPMEQIIDGLWAQNPPRSAVENVRTYVSQLRDILHRSGEDRARLESHHGGYRLTVAPDQVDVQRFTTLASSGRQALQASDFSRAALLLDEATQLWRGNPLRELELGPAIRAKAIALEEQHWHVQADWLRARLALGDHVQLVATLRELIGERPLEEALWCFLMTALYRSGRSGEALTVFAQARRIFVSELGIEPGPQLRSLQAKVLAGADLGQPATGTSATGSLVPHQLPALCPGFVGRQAELRQIQKLVEKAGTGAERVPVAAISGLPGSGKTATAIAAAATVLGAFRDGQLFVDLRGSTADPLDPVDALTSMLTGLGIPPDVIPADLIRCCYLYRSVLAGRRVLIVLDDAATAEQVAPLIPGSGKSMVIITARRWMADVDAGLRLGLMPLDTDDSLSMLGHLTGMNRVRRELASATEISNACCGLPTAIRIAGIRLAARPKLTLRLLADRFRDSFGMLDEFSLDGFCLRDSFAASYNKLSPLQQECFRALGLSEPDGISPAEVGKILRLSPRETDLRLERLAHEGLLLPGSVAGETPCYQLPALLHLFAREQLRSVQALATIGT